MNYTGIFNAIVQKAQLEMSEGNFKEIVLRLKIKSTVGSAIMVFPLRYLVKIFEILNISNFNNIINKPCIVFIKNGVMKDLGNFLFHHYDFIKIDAESKDWVYNDKDRNIIYQEEKNENKI